MSQTGQALACACSVAVCTDHIMTVLASQRCIQGHLLRHSSSKIMPLFVYESYARLVRLQFFSSPPDVLD